MLFDDLDARRGQIPHDSLFLNVPLIEDELHPNIMQGLLLPPGAVQDKVFEAGVAGFTGPVGMDRILTDLVALVLDYLLDDHPVPPPISARR